MQAENLIRGIDKPTPGKLEDKTATASAELIAALAGNCYYVTDLIVTNQNDVTGAVVKFLDGSTSKWGGFAAKGGGGFTCSFTKPFRMTSVGTALNVSLSDALTGDNTHGVFIYVDGFYAPLPTTSS